MEARHPKATGGDLVKRPILSAPRGGQLVDVSPRDVPTEWPERFRSKVEAREDGCWLWTACKNKDGYGRYGRGGRKAGVAFAHRYAYELENGSVPDALELDHLCRIPGCVRPEHLEPVTSHENTLRGDQANPLGLCRRGIHTWAGANIYTEADGSQRCRECRNAADRAKTDGIAYSLRTHCPAGHPYSDDNLYVKPNGNRECRACHRARQRIRYRELKDARVSHGAVHGEG